MRDYQRLMDQYRDLDQRLGTVINLAFQHSPGLESAFKVTVFVIVQVSE